MMRTERTGGCFRPFRRLLASFVLVALLAGCAGAQVTGVVATRATAPPPAVIAVAVDASPAIDAAQAETAQHVAQALQGQLVQRLQQAGLAAMAGPRPPGAALLHVAIVEADAGNRLARFVVGFGSGRATLQARADFEGAGPAPMTEFDTASDTGRKPGLILPGGVALATGNLVHLAIGGGIGIALQLRDGMDQPVKGTAAAIVKQLRKYYAAAGWRWPGDVRA